LKKIIIIILVLVVSISIFFVTNRKSDLPEELKKFIENTEDEYYWTVGASPSSLYVLLYYKDYYKSFSIGLFEEDILKYKDLKENLYDVNINDSRIENSMVSWIRFGNKDNPLTGPKKYDTIPYTAYDTKEYYNSITNGPAVNLKRIFNYKKMEKPFIKDWINYSARYNLKGAQGGLPIDMDGYQGKLILAFNKNYTKMNEIYLSDDEWVYIRHVEKGKYPGTINEEDLDSILESIWSNWKNVIVPIKNKL